jgi:hypothetical protein
MSFAAAAAACAASDAESMREFRAGLFGSDEYDARCFFLGWFVLFYGC